MSKARRRRDQGYPLGFPAKPSAGSDAGEPASGQRWDLDSGSAEPELVDGPAEPSPPRARKPPAGGRGKPRVPAAGSNPPAPASPPAPARSTSSARSPVYSPRNFDPGGTGGGLLLAVFLYPIGLNVIKYGAKGPGMWFNAKFLNRVPGGGDWASTPPAAAVTPKPGTPGGTPKPGTPKPGQNTGTTAGPIYPT